MTEWVVCVGQGYLYENHNKDKYLSNLEKRFYWDD
jgi:hypothetical protein